MTIKEYKNGKKLIKDLREVYENIEEAINYVNTKIEDLSEFTPELQRIDNLLKTVHSNNEVIEDMTLEQYNTHRDNLLELSNRLYDYITVNC